MNIQGRTIWQQAAGDTDRSYASLCLRWDVILNGPGHLGPWPDCVKPLADAGGTSRKLSDLRRFSEEMDDSDLVVLRSGTTDVLGVGEVVGPYEHLEAFGDVDGWSLQHVRRVRWLWKASDGAKRFDTYSLKWGDTTQPLSNQEVEGWLESLDVPKSSLERPLEALPSESGTEVGLNEVSEFLFDQGVASFSINSLVNQVGELTRIAKWYQRSNHPSEHETVAYLVVPLLRVLGWTPQRMAVEWNRVDVALFASLPRSDDNLRVVVEAKRMDMSCLTAKSQAQGYAEGKRQCHRLIVTDGIRYGVYSRDEGGAFDLFAYLNLSRMRSHYPIYQCAGARNAFFSMTPEWTS